jgi:hypothetical protein
VYSARAQSLGSFRNFEAGREVEEFIGDAQQHFTLALSPDTSRLDGYGDGFFLDHTNLNMQRMTDPASATPSK